MTHIIILTKYFNYKRNWRTGFDTVFVKTDRDDISRDSPKRNYVEYCVPYAYPSLNVLHVYGSSGLFP